MNKDVLMPCPKCKSGNLSLSLIEKTAMGDCVCVECKSCKLGAGAYGETEDEAYMRCVIEWNRHAMNWEGMTHE